jgi:DNA-binding transcriptional ArsR family regulator
MDSLAALLSSRVKAETFRLLFAPGAGELHVREIARRAGLNEATIRQELKQLEGSGLVLRRRDGNRVLYGANPVHPLFDDIQSLVAKTSGLTAVLRSALEPARARVAFVFGSMADGSAKPESDVDLMIVGDLTLRGATKHLSRVGTRIAREVNPHVMTPEEFAQRRKARDHFITTVLAGPKLFVIGDAHELEAVGR